MFFQKIPNFTTFNNTEVPQILKLLKVTSKNQVVWP